MNFWLPTIKVPFSWNSIYSLSFIIFNCVRKMIKAIISFVMYICLSVRPSARNNSGLIWWIFMNFHTWLYQSFFTNWWPSELA